MKKEFVTLKEALPGFVAECTKVANSENPTLVDFHVSDRRSLNYFLKRPIVLSLHRIIDKGDKKERTRSMRYVLYHAYKAIGMLLRRKFSDFYRMLFKINYYLKDFQHPEFEEIPYDLIPVCNGVILYIFEMLDEDNFNLFRLTDGLWGYEYQTNDIYKRLKNDEELADLANRKVWRLWTEEDDDKEVEDVEKENVEKEEAGKEITSGESSPIDIYFSISDSPLLRENMKKAVEFCGETKSNLAILEFVIKDKQYTSCISRHKLFLQMLDAMGIKKYDDDTYKTMKEKYRLLKNTKNEWSEEDEEKYAALMKIFEK